MSDERTFHPTQTDFSLCESSSEMQPQSLPNMVLPIGGASTPSMCGDGFLVATVEGPEGKVGLIAVGMIGAAGIHMPCSANILRAFAANVMRTADLLDGGRGKQ